MFKGHKKDKTSDRSYRTISTCPVVAKALDLYIRELFIDEWNLDKAETQYQGEGSSHELAALLLTEVIQYSLYTAKEPVFVIYLDAKSAFDVVLKELLIKNLFHCNTNGHSLLYLNNRLETFVEWEGQLMGPILDQRSLEQGGPNSSDPYKVFRKEQLATSQASKLGIKLGKQVISGIGLADDTLHVSNNINKLFYLLHLTHLFCMKYQVELCGEKTKLQVFATKEMDFFVEYAKYMNPIKVNNEKIEFVDSAEHVDCWHAKIHCWKSSDHPCQVQSTQTSHSFCTSCWLGQGTSWESGCWIQSSPVIWNASSHVWTCLSST